MMYLLESYNTNPYYNLALEQYVFDNLDRSHSYFMLWQNDNTIVVGKHQNTAEEINASYVKENNITVVRRLSGGGAVYHDLGNLNFTFITDHIDGQIFDFSTFCKPVAKALASMGVKVEISGRNDMTIDGKKFSGNAMYMKEGRVMHHGTLMFDSNPQIMEQALRVSKDKIESKGVKSVRGRVTNIKPYLSENITMDEFRQALRKFMISENNMLPYTLTEQDLQSIHHLQETVYSQWEWNYGTSPSYTIRKKRRIENCGSIEIFINVGKKGIIEDISFYGDYFGNGNPNELTAVLKGHQIEEHSLSEALEGIDVGYYINNLKRNELLDILLS